MGEFRGKTGKDPENQGKIPENGAIRGGLFQALFPLLPPRRAHSRSIPPQPPTQNHRPGRENGEWKIEKENGETGDGGRETGDGDGGWGSGGHAGPPLRRGCGRRGVVTPPYGVGVGFYEEIF